MFILLKIRDWVPFMLWSFVNYHISTFLWSNQSLIHLHQLLLTSRVINCAGCWETIFTVSKLTFGLLANLMVFLKPTLLKSVGRARFSQETRVDSSTSRPWCNLEPTRQPTSYICLRVRSAQVLYTISLRRTQSYSTYQLMILPVRNLQVLPCPQSPKSSLVWCLYAWNPSYACSRQQRYISGLGGLLLDR